MDRHLHKVKYIPQCPRQAALVDQYMWEQKDTNKYMCYNGISHPIYDCKGWINYSLPLEEYPPVDSIHPQIAMVKRPHLNYRGSSSLKERYSHLSNGKRKEPHFVLATDRVPGYPLGSPYGDQRYCSSCSRY